MSRRDVRIASAIVVGLAGIYCLGYHVGATAASPNNALLMFGVFVGLVICVAGIMFLCGLDS